MKGTKKERIIFEPEAKDQILLKDGKKFRLLKQTIENGHIKEVIFEEINEPEYETQLEEISSYLINKSGLDAQTIVKDILRQLDSGYLNKLSIEVKKESPVEIIPGCLSLKIGKKKIDIVE